MCGIAGMLVASQGMLSEDVLRRMGTVQTHRGPDNMGILLTERCGFVHNRLSLLDLSPAGNQPMVYGDHVLVFNGELYNFRELRSELEARGVAFTSTSDTEVLLHALIIWGVETALKRIRGMFAFSFYNTTTGDLYLCRDRYGIKPLHYTLIDGALCWASELKALHQVRPLQIDPIQALYSIALNAEFHYETTLFAGVSSVEPGSYLHARAGGTPTISRYYEMLDDFDPAYYRELDALSMEEAARRLDHLMSESVRRMLIADAPMGIFLSGGIDSSLLTALAVRHTRQISLFTSNILGRLTEFPDAQAVAKHVDLPLYDAPFKPDDFMKYWAECTWHYEVPIVRHPSAMPMSRVARLARDTQVKAVLTGEGSDELFYGYPYLLMERYKKLAQLPLKGIEKLYDVVPGVRRYLLPKEDERVSDFLDLLVQRWERQRWREDARDTFSFMEETEFRQQYLAIQSMKEHIVSLLLRNDRMGMISSIEARFPFLDEEVVRFGINLPDKFKIGRSTRFHNIMHPFLIDKAVVRQVCEPILPARITHKKKLGFPLHAHKELRVAPAFFTGGYAESLLHMQPAVAEYMTRTQNPRFVARVAALDIFGRLYALGESQAAVTERIEQHITMNAQ